jgi:hypothetical protein
MEPLDIAVYRSFAAHPGLTVAILLTMGPNDSIAAFHIT